MTQQDGKDRRLPYIDALRGIAILGVLAVHTHQVAPPAWVPLATVATNGHFGVQLFYLMSAFTLMVSRQRRAGREIGVWRNYVTRRFFRIAPMYWVAILAYLSVMGLAPRHYAPDGVTWWAVFGNFFFLHGWHPEWINSVVPVGWSVGVEESFYAILPLLALAITTWERAAIACVVSLPLAAWLAPLALKAFPGVSNEVMTGFLHFWLPNQLPVFLLGILLFFALPKIAAWAEAHSRDRSLLLLAIGALLVGLLVGGTTKMLPPHIAFTLGFFCLAAALTVRPFGLLVNPVTVYFGKISYSVYLLHYLLLGQAKELIYWINSYLPRSMSADGQFLAVLGVLMVMCAGICSVTYRYIEEPCIALGKRIIERMEERRAAGRLPHVTAYLIRNGAGQ